MGCVGLGETAKGKQSIANQGQKWMGIRATIEKAGSPSKYSKKWATQRGMANREEMGQLEARGRVDASYNHVYEL